MTAMKNKKDYIARAYSFYHCSWCKYAHDARKWDTMRIYRHPDSKIVECLKCRARFAYLKKKIKSGSADMKNKFNIRSKHITWLDEYMDGW